MFLKNSQVLSKWAWVTHRGLREMQVVWQSVPLNSEELHLLDAVTAQQRNSKGTENSKKSNLKHSKFPD